MVIHSEQRWPLLLLSNICLLTQKYDRWHPQKIDPHKSSSCVDFAGSHCAFVASLWILPLPPTSQRHVCMCFKNTFNLFWLLGDMDSSQWWDHGSWHGEPAPMSMVS